MEYGIKATVQYQAAGVFGLMTEVPKTTTGYPWPMVAGGGNTINPNVFQCCGLFTMSGFGNIKLDTFEKKAAYLSGLYKLYGRMGPANLLYALAGHQLKDKGYEHELFVELGAKELISFPNLTHGPSDIHIFHVNIRNAVDKYITKQGEPLKDPNPKPAVAQPVAPKAVIPAAPRFN